METPRSARPSALLARLGLGRPEARAWALYDWANSAFYATVVAAVFPVYFASVVAADLPPSAATTRFATTTTVALAISAAISPILGAVADYRAVKKGMLAVFAALGVLATAGMFFLRRGDWAGACVLFAVGNIGATGSLVFYDALLPHVAAEPDRDRLSSAGYAAGFLGSGLLLAAQVLWIGKPRSFGFADADAATRFSFLTVALWWLLFTIPLLRGVPEPPRLLERDERLGLNPLQVGFTRLRETLRELRGYRQAFTFLLAFLLYSEGIGTIIRMSAAFGTEIGLPAGSLVGSLLLVQFVGIPFTYLFGALAGRIGAKRAIFLSLAVYMAVSVLGCFLRTSLHFFLLAILVGTVQGGSQALSRSLFASLVPRHKSAEFFALFAVSDKFAGILGPLLFGIAVAATGSGRSAILSLILFFLLGGALLARVDVEEGRRHARRIEEETLAAPG